MILKKGNNPKVKIETFRMEACGKLKKSKNETNEQYF